MSNLPVIVEVEENAEINPDFNPYEQATLSRGGQPLVTKVNKQVLKQLDTETLKASFAEIRSSLDEVFSESNKVGHFELSQVKVTLEVKAEGGFALVGSATAGVKGGISLTFSPSK